MKYSKFFIFKILLILIFFILFFSCNVKASSDEYSFFYNEKKYYYTLPDDCRDFIIAYDSNNRFHLFYSKDTESFFNYSIRGSYPSIDCYTDITFETKKTYYRSYGDFYAIEQSDGTYFLDFKNCTTLRSYNTYSNFLGLCRSTVDIYNTDGTIFFQGTPHLELVMKIMAEKSEGEIKMMVLMIIAVVVCLVISLIGLKRGFQTLVSGLKT